MGDLVPGDWVPRLAGAMAGAVREFAPALAGAPVVLLAVDCHPWHGSLDLAALTAEEVAADPALHDPDEMAAWRHFGFSDGLAAWRPASELGREMRVAYDSATDPAAVAEAFLRAVALAAATPEVAGAVALLERAEGFRISVAHPDDGREFTTVF